MTTQKVFVATATFHTEVNGIPTTVHKDQRVRDGHPVLGGRPDLFREADVAPQFETADPGGTVESGGTTPAPLPPDPRHVAESDPGQARDPSESVYPSPGEQERMTALASREDLEARTLDDLRVMASERGVDVDTIQGTGQGGRVLKNDVIDAMVAHG